MPPVTASIVRSRAMITRVDDRHACETLAGGAFLQQDGIILAVGSAEDLCRRYPRTRVLGSSDDIVLPGLVNAHHHVGLTPFQLGAPDLPLELWTIARLAARDVDPYLDTLYSAFEMVGSGVTTVQHIQDQIEGDLTAVKSRMDEVLRAYHDIGMRASICYGIADQNHFVHEADNVFLATLPPRLAGSLRQILDRTRVALDGSIELFETLHTEHRQSRRVRVQLAPANLHWCSDRALKTLSRVAGDCGVKLHMHLLETRAQRQYAELRAGGSALDHLDRVGLLGPQMTLGHGVWLTERDVMRLAASGTSVCHNCSSNLRLRSGRAPINRLEACGVRIAIGIDEAGLNDDRDMLQEMRLVLRAHRDPGLDPDDVPGVGQVLRMATVGGALTTGFEETLGTLEPGKAADAFLLDWRRLAGPYIDPSVPVADAVLLRAKPQAVRLVMCDGEVLYEDGRFRGIDQAAVISELHSRMTRALGPDEADRKTLASEVMPYARKFYQERSSSEMQACKEPGC